MSLLKGIVFIPRDKKLDTITIQENQIDDKKRKSRDHKKSKSTGKDKKHKKDHSQKSSKSSRHKDDSKRANYSSSDDEDFKDFSKYKDEIKLIDIADRTDDAVLTDEDRYSFSASRTQESSTSSEQQKSTFSSLIGSLTSKPSRSNDSEYEIERKISLSSAGDGIELRSNAGIATSVRHSTGSDFASEEYSAEKTLSFSKGNATIDIISIKEVEVSNQQPSNQSAAQMFRAKLKATKGGQIAEKRSLTELIQDEERDLESDLLLENEERIRNQVINKLRNDGKNGSHTDTNRMVDKNSKTGNKNYAENKMDISLLMKSEKFGSNDMDENFRDNVLRLGARYKGTELGKTGAFGNGDLTGQDEEEEIDMKMFENKYETDEKIKTKKQMLKSIGNEKKRDSAADGEKQNERQRDMLNRCSHCSQSASYKPHLTLSKGEHTMLRLKTGPNTLGSGHCIITPLSHSPSFLKCDDDVAVEVARFKSCLRRMWEQNGMAVLFIESAVRFGKHPHACIDAVPVPLGMDVEARMCFREAFNSADEEWATHKKLIDLTPKRPLHCAVPKHWEYLVVEWGSGMEAQTEVVGGAHAVENESKIGEDFCLDVVAGMLDVDIRMGRKGGNKYDSRQEEADKKSVVEFKQMWGSHDWTQYT